MLGQICALFVGLTSAFGIQDGSDLRIAKPDLLKNASVLKELKATDEQVAAMEQIRKDFAESHKNSNYDVKDERVLENKLLSADQLKRLREITLQSYGPAGLMDDDVARRVGLNVDEMKRVHKVFMDAVDARVAPLRDYAKSEGEAIGKMAEKDPAGAQARAKELEAKVAEMSKKLREEDLVHCADKPILDSLTATERKAWQDLQGKPFPVEGLKERFN